jgi:nitrate/TMAO reductase-like tetraheme cytochrome c subunit
MIPARKKFVPAIISTLLFLVTLGLGAPVVAEDLSDNETCLECHAGEPWSAPESTDRPRVHNDDGSFAVEDHEMWSCVDCHDMIEEIPHPEGVDGHAVNCENCHDSTPTME